MTRPRVHLGDTHNFGRRVEAHDGRIEKPRTVRWEELLLSAESPLRTLLAERAEQAGLGREAFEFLPDLAFTFTDDRGGGSVSRVELSPLPSSLSEEQQRTLARVTGRAIALFAFLGVADLHWENLVIGLDARGRTIFGPLDVEMILGDLGLPTETKLLPDADPEVAEVCRHAAGVRRVLPFLGKPIGAQNLVAMAASYRRTLAFLDRNGRAIADVFANLPGLGDTPIRILLRGTDEYVRAKTDPRSLWPPLLAAESEQLARGDIPYFFRLYDKPGIHYFTSADLTQTGTLPTKGDVPKLDPILSLARGLRAPSRKKLQEEGLFTLLGAFDHKSFTGTHEDDDLAVTFRARTLMVKPKKGEELGVSRDLRAFVGSVYLPCRCGESASVFVPDVTTCEAC